MIRRGSTVGRALGVVLLVGTVAGVAGCGRDGSEAPKEATKGERIATVRPDLLPPEVLGLRVTAEDVKGQVESLEQASVDEVGMYSLRRGDLLMATLQVARANEAAGEDLDRFRKALVARISNLRSQQIKVGDRTVYVSSGTKQRLMLWFRDRYFFVLATRDEFDRRRSLLRTLLEVSP